MNKRIRTVILLVILVALLAPVGSLAGDVEKKWRLSVAAGQSDSTHKIDSDAANVLQVVSPEFFLEDAYIDPRDDSDAFTNLSIEPATSFTLSAQYAVSKIFLVEASVGYQKGDVGDVQMSAQFDNIERLPEVPFRFEAYNLPAGELERVPIRLSGVLRLRPKARFNPYFGAGIGYSVIGFEPSAELNELSQNLDASIGSPTSLTPVTNGTPVLLISQDSSGLTGAEVDARDTFEWHLIGGAELEIKRAWSLFVDMRWIDASRDLHLQFNGEDNLGVPVPQFIDFIGAPQTIGPFGPVRISTGGLIDAGTVRLVPSDSVPVDTDCTVPANQDLCVQRFFFEPDGELDSGFYYVQGGRVAYDGFSLQVGARFTFGKK